MPGANVVTMAEFAGLEAPRTLEFTAKAATPAAMTPTTETVVAIPVFMTQSSIRGMFPDDSKSTRVQYRGRCGVIQDSVKK
jgi:hypothetical protein